MAVTSQQIVDFLLANPNMSDAQIAAAMQEFSVTPAMMAAAVNVPVQAVQERYIAAAPSTETAENINKLASQILAQGTTEAWTGGLPPEKAALYMASDLAKSGVTNIEQITKSDTGIVNAMTGEKLVSGYGERTGGNLWSGSYEGKGNTGFGVNFDESGKPVFYTQGASSSTLKNDVLKLAAVAGAVYGLGGFEGLFGGAAGGAAGTIGTTGLTLAELGGTAGAGALTAAESAALYGTGASALGTAGVIGSDLAGLSGIPAGTGALTAAESAALYGTGGLTTGALTAGGAGTAGLMGTGTGLTTAGVGGLGGTSGVASLGGATGAGITAGTAGLGALGTGAGLGTAGLTTAGLVGANTLLGGAGLGTTLAGLGAGVGGSLLGTAATGLGAGNLANLLSGGLGTAGSLLQMQQSKEAALAAQQRIDAETAAAKTAAQFRPIGKTTRFGTSQFQVDPKTGQLTSAGYTLSPEAKNAQDRFLTLAGQGLTQAEQAQQQFAPLQTGAQNLFSLGNQYISKSPQDVAQNYLNQQMALLQPGRETELANLQNRLQQQGRGGLSVAQGGTLGATAPELQALYNARAQQEAQLAANAQQYGQQQVAFGAGLLGTGAQTMGQYYGGQQAAYSPYTTALGQVQNLETLAQQPLTMGANLAQQAATAGANVGKLGLTGAQLSTNLATSANATANPYAQALMAAGNPNAMFGQALGNVFGGLFS
jgi:hypothetical protein